MGEAISLHERVGDHVIGTALLSVQLSVTAARCGEVIVRRMGRWKGLVPILTLSVRRLYWRCVWRWDIIWLCLPRVESISLWMRGRWSGLLRAFLRGVRAGGRYIGFLLRGWSPEVVGIWMGRGSFMAGMDLSSRAMCL
jgi:hypothetical protein